MSGIIKDVDVIKCRYDAGGEESRPLQTFTHIAGVWNTHDICLLY